MNRYIDGGGGRGGETKEKEVEERILRERKLLEGGSGFRCLPETEREEGKR